MNQNLLVAQLLLDMCWLLFSDDGGCARSIAAFRHPAVAKTAIGLGARFSVARAETFCTVGGFHRKTA